MLLDLSESQDAWVELQGLKKLQVSEGSQVRKTKFKVSKMVDVMGWKAIGTKLVDFSKTVEMNWENKVVIKDPNDAQPELF